MNVRTIVVVILSIACGGAAMWAVQFWIQREHSTTAVQSPPKVETVDIVVAKMDIPLGTRLSTQWLTTTKWPKESQPRGVVLAENIESVYGQVTRADIYRDDLILDVKYGADRPVSSLLADGQRAYTIEISKSPSSVAGFVQPGDKVDIHFTDVRDTRLTGGLATKLLLQDVLIIGVDRAPQSPGLASKARSATLSLTPEEVRVLILAQSQGTLSLTLRGDGDDIVLSVPLHKTRPVDPVEAGRKLDELDGI